MMKALRDKHKGVSRVLGSRIRKKIGKIELAKVAAQDKNKKIELARIAAEKAKERRVGAKSRKRLFSSVAV